MTAARVIWIPEDGEPVEFSADLTIRVVSNDSPEGESPSVTRCVLMDPPAPQAGEEGAPSPSTPARVVHAIVIPSDNTTPVKMHWRCSCGGGGQNYPGEQTRCAYCRWPVVIPTEPLDALPADQTTDGGELTFVRDENNECVLPPQTRRFLVARWPGGLTKVREVLMSEAEE